MIPLLFLLQAAAAATTPAAPPPWTVTTRPSADPTITSTLTGVTSADGNARLIVRCDAGAAKVVSVQLFSKVPLGGPPDRPVSLTVDGGMAMIDNWEFVEKGAYERGEVAVTTLTTAIAKGKTIALHTTTAAGVAVDATFAGPSNAQPVTGVLAACGYTLGAVPVAAPTPKPTK
ncbi:hypothetical protein [uncultured Sphingomonas sp.]|uniref:hypothetical protein n=1 Tax=uncultured Sphingomonas sp. TaxID=158754 RepID=UPI0035CA2A18